MHFQAEKIAKSGDNMTLGRLDSRPFRHGAKQQPGGASRVCGANEVFSRRRVMTIRRFGRMIHSVEPEIEVALT